MNRIKSAFIGTGAFGKPILEKLIQDDRFEIMVITGQDTPQGRGLFTVESDIKKVALLNKLIVRQPIDKLELNQILFQSKPDVLLVVAYGKILTRETLNIAHFGAVNIHASLLPKYRGASPIQEALIHGDTQTGIAWIQMTPKMDAGPILTQEKLPIGKEDTYQSLAKKLAALAAVHTTSILSQFVAGKMRGNSQNERNATYCKKITKEDGFVDFIKESATQIYNKLRAYTPWPGCYFFLNGKRIKIVQARVIEQKISTGEIVLSEEGNIIIGTLQKALLINKLQPESKRVMNASEFVKGLQNKCLTLLAKSSV